MDADARDPRRYGLGMTFPGVSIAGYRSLAEPTWIDLTGHFTILLGPNNAGKSNVLRFLDVHLQDAFSSISSGRQLSSFDSRLDVPNAWPENQLRVAWPVDVDRLDDTFTESRMRIFDHLGQDPVPTLPFRWSTLDGDAAPDVDAVELQTS
ncbi:hypothetical protein B7486_77675, partial [cyanobacterium TDX16]